MRYRLRLCLPRNNPEQMHNAIMSEIERRGFPLKKTAWGPQEVRSYIKYQIHMRAEGRLREADFGGFAFKLPSKSPENAPAPLPEEIQLWLRTGSLPPVDSTPRRAPSSAPSRGTVR